MDMSTVKNQFPVFQHHPDLVYLDTAASSQKPVKVINRLTEFYRSSNANIHRGIYHLSEVATGQYEQARRTVAEFIHAGHPEEIIFTRGTTEGINLVAQSWGEANVRAGDEIVVSHLEHHANFLPWQRLAERTGAQFRVIPVTDQGIITAETVAHTISAKTKIVAITHASNVLGVIPPLAEIVKRAHEVGARVLIDAAQSVAHLPTDVKQLDCDFLVFSGHKMYGPTGIGVLYGKKDLLNSMEPYQVGGGMIREVTIAKTTWADLPDKFEAGTPPFAQAIGLGEAVRFLQEIGFDSIREHESNLLAYAFERLQQLENLTVFGPCDTLQCEGVVSFLLSDIHAHDVASLLDDQNVAVRVGHHCAQPLMTRLGVPATTRASFGVYNKREDVDRLIAGLHHARKIFNT